MAWTAYAVSFRLLSPMHIGWRKLGNLQQTRPYVTGRNLWGALTARLTRENRSRDYRGIGEEIDKQLAFTYFYPSTTEEPDEVSLWPWSGQWDDFAWTFMGSYASTSLGNGRNAEEGSLYETEFIAPYTRGSSPQRVYLVGYIFERADNSINIPWQGVLDKLQLGGERSYGWGRIRHLPEWCKLVTNNKYFGYKLDCSGDHPLLIASRNDLRLLAHIDTNNDPNDQRGAIEPLLGRETRVDNGFGRSFSDPKICWIPGGKVDEGESFQILEKGIWKRYP